MDPAYIEQYENFEMRHWWFVARREIIEQALDECVAQHEARTGSQPRWLDVGCGTGVLLDTYGRIDTAHKVGLDVDSACVERGRAKGLDLRLSEMNWNLAQHGSFDLITLCDVLEHVEDESAALNAVTAALSEGGTLLVTVPAMRGLWSGHDVVNHHFRRYSRHDLLKRFAPATWHIQWASYFSSLLLPLIYTVRKIKILGEGLGWWQAEHDFKFGPRWLDRMLLGAFRMEKPLLRRHSKALRLGTSLLLVARKRRLAPIPLDEQESISFAAAAPAR